MPIILEIKLTGKDPWDRSSTEQLSLCSDGGGKDSCVLAPSVSRECGDWGKGITQNNIILALQQDLQSPSPSCRWHWLAQSQLEIQLIVDGSDSLISKDSHWIINEPGIEIIYMLWYLYEYFSFTA